MERQTIVFDFDGVIHSYTSGWQGIDVIPDPPVPGIKEVIDKLSKKYNVVIVTTRCGALHGELAVRRWLIKHGICVYNVQGEKPPAVCYIDDRAICFDGNADTLLEKIENFKPWYEVGGKR